MFKKLLPIIIVVFLLFWAVKPLTVPGFFPIHDNEQVGRLYELDQAVKASHIPPRLSQNLGFGYDYPFFNFYPPFAYYVAEIFVLIGFSYIVATKIMIFLGFGFAAVFMYLFAGKYFGTIGGVVASVAYTFAPYHAVDVYVRGALPEFWSFVFLPILFWGYGVLAETTRRKRYVVLLSFLNAFFILTHNLVAMMSGLLLVPFLLYLLAHAKEKTKFAIDVLITAVCGLGLSSYFWLPSFLEKKYTMIELLTKELADYNQHFLYLRQLWDSPWGYGGSLYGLFDGLSFEAGKVQILLVVITVCFLFVYKKTKNVSLILLFFFLFLLSLFMTTFHSKFIWDIIPPFSYIQFPWRFLLFGAFTSAFLSASFFSYPIKKGIKIGIAAVVISLIIFINAPHFTPSSYLRDVTDTNYVSKDVLRWDTSKIAAEYVPIGIATRKTDIGTTIVDINKKEVAKISYQIIKGDMNVIVNTDRPQIKEFLVYAKTEGILRLNTFSFPGWKVTLNGKEVAFTDNNKLKLITLSVPKGKFVILAEFVNTPIRTIGNSLSLASLCFLLLYFFIDSRRIAKAGMIKRTYEKS